MQSENPQVGILKMLRLSYWRRRSKVMKRVTVIILVLLLLSGCGTVHAGSSTEETVSLFEPVISRSESSTADIREPISELTPTDGELLPDTESKEVIPADSSEAQNETSVFSSAGNGVAEESGEPVEPVISETPECSQGGTEARLRRKHLSQLCTAIRCPNRARN